MARLNRRVDGSGYYVTSIFTRHGVTRKVTYQTEPRALELFAAQGIRSGDEIPRKVFFDLLEEGLLFTGGGGAGEELAEQTTPSQPDRRQNQPTRRQIPTRITAELLNDDGSFISFGAFKLQYGGSAGYPDDVLRRAHQELTKLYESSLGMQVATILSSHKPVAIKRGPGNVVVEFVPRSTSESTSPATESDYAIHEAERRDKTRRQSLRSRLDPMDKPGKSGGYQPGW